MMSLLRTPRHLPPIFMAVLRRKDLISAAQSIFFGHSQQCCHLDKCLTLSQPVFEVQAAKAENTDISLNFRIPNLLNLERN